MNTEYVAIYCYLHQLSLPTTSMQDAGFPRPQDNDVDDSMTMKNEATPPAPPADASVDLAEKDASLDPKMTVMGGGEKEKAADYANCKLAVFRCTVLCM